VKARYDYLPFGEELPAGIGGRTTAMKYDAPDSTKQRFTSKERDTESSLDYFLARYYSSAQGRFTSPDEFTGGPSELFDFSAIASANPTFYADLTTPQSLNKYQYCYGNPLIYVDPTGHQQALTQRMMLEHNQKVPPITDAVEYAGSALTGVRKGVENTFKNTHNLAAPAAGTQPLPLATPNNEVEARWMKATEDTLFLGSLASGFKGGAKGLGVGVMAAQGEQTAIITGKAGGLAGNNITFASKAGAEAINIVKQGGTHDSLVVSGQVGTKVSVIPTRTEAEKLIAAAGGRIDRVEKAHQARGHPYPHINYTLPGDKKATLQIESVGKEFHRTPRKN
jgi:RHS repeat-associated protein